MSHTSLNIPSPNPLPFTPQQHSLHDSIDDTTKLSNTSSTNSIASLLKKRFIDGKEWTDVGQDACIVLNNVFGDLQECDLDEDAFRDKVEKWRSGIGNLDGVGKLVAHVYDGVKKDELDHAIFFLGESGSGKTETRKSFLRHLIALSKTPRKKSRVLSGAYKMEILLEAFGHAHLPHSPNASRFGRYTEYQYDSTGKMIGVKLLDFFLDTNRVTAGATIPEGERNFNIFYHLLAGASPEDKSRLRLSDPKDFYYLGGGGPPSSSSKYTTGTLSRKGSTLARKGTLTRTLTRATSVSRKGTLTRTFSLRRSNTLTSPTNPIHTLTPADTDQYTTLVSTLKSLGIGRRAQTHLTAILSAILHLGNLIFISDPSNPTDACRVKNTATLDFIADLLGVDPQALETTLTYSTKMVSGTVCSVFLDVDGAEQRRNALARALYEGLVKWIVEHLNRRLCRDDPEVRSFISVIDMPGTVKLHGLLGGYEDLVVNWANEKVLRCVQEILFQNVYREVAGDGVMVTDIPQFPDNSPVVELVGSLLPVLEEGSKNGDEQNQSGAERLGEHIQRLGERNKAFIPGSRTPYYLQSNTSTTLPTNPSTLFAIKHYDGPVTYSTTTLSGGGNTVPSDFVTLFRGIESETGGMIQPPSTNAFASHLFSEKAGVKIGSGNKGKAFVVAERRVGRRPSVRRKGVPVPPPSEEGSESDGNGAGRHVLNQVLETMSQTRQYFVFGFKTADVKAEFEGGVDVGCLRRQVDVFGIPALSTFRAKIPVSADGVDFADFERRYGSLLMTPNGSMTPVEFLKSMGWEAVVGRSKIFLMRQQWRILNRMVEEREADIPLAATSAGRYSLGYSLAHQMHLQDGRPGSRATRTSSGGRESVASFGSHVQLTERREREANRESGGWSDESDTSSVYGSEFSYGGKRRSRVGSIGEVELGKFGGRGEDVPPLPSYSPATPTPTRKKRLTTTRRNWLCLTWCLTFWIPSIFLKWCGGLRTPQTRLAWREKVALCVIIAVISLSLLFFIIGLSWIVCPPQKIRTMEEVASMSSKKQVYVSLYGKYLDVTSLMGSHLRDYGGGVGGLAEYDLEPFYGGDVSKLFFREWGDFCEGEAPVGWDNVGTGNGGPFGERARGRELHAARGVDGSVRRYVEYMNRFVKGRVGWSMDALRREKSDQKVYIKIFSNIYYLTTYFQLNPNPFPPTAQSILSQSQGTLDLTSQWASYRATNPAEADATLRCMNAMWYIGTVDTRNTAACRFTNWVLVAASIVLVAVIGVKFVAAIRFVGKKDPEQCDKFVICLVTAYTEGEDELRKTIDSLAINKYDDRRKLLFIVSDGMIVGAGNDRPTPRIILDILGVDSRVNPPTVSYKALGTGSKQYNLAKVYAGVYETRGHSVPFVVVNKVGAGHERVKPGNRGKRDSQLVLMRWLSRCFYGVGLSPLEVELRWAVERVLGVGVRVYEFVLMVDADTEVDKGAVNGLVSKCVDDAKVMGLCGETRLSNEKSTWVTAIQVYEYFISHHLSKAFESLFGTVTCLPGCFCLYRIRTPPTASHPSTPLLIHEGVLNEYSENEVDTLHKKNLLTLGEDRYLTTVMLRNFPSHKTQFTSSAKCSTTAPDTWSVLLSQRRRWINSTVHNLLELSTQKNLCGFWCFSMRFVVIVDLVATFVQPASVLYVGYLIYLVATGGFGEGGMVFPVLSLVLVAAIYGFQVVIFLMRRQWSHLVWMVIYLVSLPVFAFYIPLYSFWHFDDFSWGNTRVVVGEKGRKKVVEGDGGKFDERLVPLVMWEEVERRRGVGVGNVGVVGVGERSSFVEGYGVEGYAASGYAPSNYAPSNYAPSNYAPPNNAPSGYAPPRSSYSPSTISPSTYSPTPALPYPIPPPHQPSTETLLTEIRRILSTTDLMTVTKKGVREELGRVFGVDLRTRKEEIGRLVDGVLDGEM